MTAPLATSEKVTSGAAAPVSDARPKAGQCRDDLSIFGLIAPPQRGCTEWTDIAADYAAPNPANWIA
jgi:hypothetical protein